MSATGARPPIDRRLVKRYQCPHVAVELVVVTEDRSLRRRGQKEWRTLARLLDVSVTGVRVELLAEPEVPAGARLELIWSGNTAYVEISNSRISDISGLVELGLQIVGADDGFRDNLHSTVDAARGVSRLEQAWQQAR